MKNKMIYIALGFSLLLGFSCSQNQKDEVLKEMKIEHSEKISEGAESKNIAILGVEGMTCQVGCAGKIQQTLAALDGVVSCEVAFEDKKAHVQFDDAKISEKELISAIEALNDKQYKVTRVEIEKTVVKHKEESVEENDSEKKVSLIKPRRIIKFPNIFSTLTRLYAY